MFPFYFTIPISNPKSETQETVIGQFFTFFYRHFRFHNCDNIFKFRDPENRSITIVIKIGQFSRFWPRFWTFFFFTILERDFSFYNQKPIESWYNNYRRNWTIFESLAMFLDWFSHSPNNLLHIWCQFFLFFVSSIYLSYNQLFAKNENKIGGELNSVNCCGSWRDAA